MPFSTSLGTTYERPGEVSEPLVLGKPVTVVPGPFPEVIGTRFQALRLISLESGVAAYRDESSS